MDDAINWSRRAITLVEPSANDEILSNALNSLGTARLVAGDMSGWADLERSLHPALAGGYQGHGLAPNVPIAPRAAASANQ